MKAAPFDYVKPKTISEAITALESAGGDAKIIAGGQSLVPLLALRMTAPSLLVDIAGIVALHGIEITPSGTRIGALSRWRDIEHHKPLFAAQPLLATAVRHIAHYQIRSRGTIGGSCAHADPASEMPAVALTCSAAFEIAGLHGTRSVTAEEFFLGALTTVLEPNEILVAIHLPPWPTDRRFAFHEFARRAGDFALAGCVVLFDLDDKGCCQNSRFGVFGVDERPRRLSEIEAALDGRVMTSTLAADLGELAANVVNPHSDLHAPAAYRRSLLRVLAERALLDAGTPERLAA